MSPAPINRRTFLKGLGAATGLASGLFNSRVAMGQTDTAPVRLLLVALQHGWGRNRNVEDFTGTETDFTLPRPLAPFEAIKEQCVFVDGLRGTLWGNAHDVSYSDIFTASVPWGESGSAQLGNHFPEPVGPSIDWVIGNALGKDVLRVSARYRSWGKAYHPLCFDSAAQRQPFYTSPRETYDALLAPLAAEANQSEALKRIRKTRRENLFQFLGRDMDRMLARVGGTERLKLETHLTALNDLSERLNRPTAGIDITDIPDRPGEGPGFSQDVDNFFDIIRFGFGTDLYRVAVLGLGEGVEDWGWVDKAGQQRSGNTFDQEGFHQDVAHYGDAEDPRFCYEGWCQWYAQKIVGLVQSLAATEDIDGNSLLDNTIIVLTGEVETGGHDTRKKLHTVIGGGNRIARGRWLNLPVVEPRNRQGVFIGGRKRDGTKEESGINYGLPFGRHHHADLWVSIARLCGVEMDSFGLDVYNHAPIPLSV